MISWGPRILFQVTGKSFCAGGMLINGRVVEIAPYLRKLGFEGKTFAYLEDVCIDKGWRFNMVARVRLDKNKKEEYVEVTEKIEANVEVHRYVGFTGTREGMTRAQKIALKELLRKLFREDLTCFFRHGDCLGADAEAHNIAIDCGYHVLIHPPENEKLRAFCTNAFSVLPIRPYLERNLRIVEKSEFLLAAPKDLGDDGKGGTWATIKMANNTGCPVRIIFPDGSFKRGREKSND